MPTKLESCIQNSATLSDFLYDTLGTKADLDVRGKFAMAYLSLCLDHREAILLLVKVGAYASATALQRPLLEAFVSGVWVSDNATEEGVEDIASLNRPPPTYEKMAQRLRKGHTLGEWFEVLRAHYKIFGDYTHGHQRQLSRWLTPDFVGPKYSEDHLVEILQHSDMIGLMAAVLRETLCDRPVCTLIEAVDSMIHGQKCEYPGAVLARTF